MYRIFLLCFLAGVSASAIVIQRLPVIHEVESVRSVGGVINCGSKGLVLEVNITDCYATPCNLKVGSMYALDLDFIPSAEYPGIDFEASIVKDGRDTMILKTKVDGPIIPSKSYKLQASWVVTGDYGDGLLAVRIKLVEEDYVEICSYITAHITK